MMNRIIPVANEQIAITAKLARMSVGFAFEKGFLIDSDKMNLKGDRRTNTVPEISINNITAGGKISKAFEGISDIFLLICTIVFLYLKAFLNQVKLCRCVVSCGVEK